MLEVYNEPHEMIDKSRISNIIVVVLEFFFPLYFVKALIDVQFSDLEPSI